MPSTDVEMGGEREEAFDHYASLTTHRTAKQVLMELAC